MSVVCKYFNVHVSGCKTNYNLIKKNLSKSHFDEGHSGCRCKNIAIRALKGSVLCQVWFKWIYLANLVNW